MSLPALLERLAEIHHLDQANALLNWDQRTYMPARGGDARAQQIAALAKTTHLMFTARETQDLLAAAEEKSAQLPPDSNQRAMLRVARRNLNKMIRVPTALVMALAQTCSLAEDIWQQARADNAYSAFAPWLDKILALKREYAAAVAPGTPIYDALLDDYEEAMTTARLDPLFATLKAHSVPLVAAIKNRGQKNSAEPLTRDYDEAGQEAFATFILKECGFPFDRARLDRSVHPFCTNFSQNDVRITTRYERHWLPGALFGCLHEMGHAFYELNISPEFEATPLASGVSLGVHESQSRLWENLVGRSREFWSRYYPRLQQQFPAQLAGTSLDTFYRAVNCVAPSFIRVEADEITYNLHIILRYEMEQALLTAQLSVKDAPAAWNEKMQHYLGINPADPAAGGRGDRDGILQDIHWAGGGMGYFPTYTLGNVLAAQLFESAARALPDLSADLAAGRFTPLYQWLQTNVHQYGKKYPPAELIQRATGQPLSTAPYLAYLTKKFTAIYAL